MFRTRHRHEIPSLNTTSPADISFMLLIFFLVTSSMNTDKGILRQMPPMEKEQQKEQRVKEENVMRLSLDADDHLLCDEQPIQVKELAERIRLFADHEKSRERIVMLSIHPQASYQAYFQLQNALVNGYASLQNEKAKARFGKPLKYCTQEQRQQIREQYPQRVSEDTYQKGGGDGTD